MTLCCIRGWISKASDVLLMLSSICIHCWYLRHHMCLQNTNIWADPRSWKGASTSILSSCLSHFAPNGGLGLTLGLHFYCHLFKRGDRVGYTQSPLLPPVVTSQSCSVSHVACISLKVPGWTVCDRLSTSALLLNLCEINHYQFRGSCLSVPARRHVEVSNHGLAITITTNIIIIFIVYHNHYPIGHNFNHNLCGLCFHRKWTDALSIILDNHWNTASWRQIQHKEKDALKTNEVIVRKPETPCACFQEWGKPRRSRSRCK